ncbi:MAG: uroporphyrinogen decarboxylase family protein [Planctomycetota bacterium]|jgi:uroporphyrinogen decarboxylase
MNHKERFYATINREKTDRPASWLGMPTGEALPALFSYFKVEDISSLKKKINDDIFPIEVPYHHPPANHVACAFDFAKKSDNDYEERTLTAPGFFEDVSDLDSVDSFPWPDPSEHMDSVECEKAVASAPQEFALLGVMWSAHFQDACAAFGMETALVKMVTEPDLFRAVIDRIVEFYLKANEIFYTAAKGKLDAVLIGNDLGSQSSLMVSPDALREFVFPGTKKLVEQAKEFGIKVIHHSCGAIYEIIPDLIAVGVDAIHPIQALAHNMQAERLKKDFGEKVSYCGGVDTQDLLVNGSSKDVRERVEELKDLFPTGLIVSPSHEAILPDVPPENIEALFNALNHL